MTERSSLIWCTRHWRTTTTWGLGLYVVRGNTGERRVEVHVVLGAQHMMLAHRGDDATDQDQVEAAERPAARPVRYTGDVWEVWNTKRGTVTGTYVQPADAIWELAAQLKRLPDEKVNAHFGNLRLVLRSGPQRQVTLIGNGPELLATVRREGSLAPRHRIGLDSEQWIRGVDPDSSAAGFLESVFLSDRVERVPISVSRESGKGSGDYRPVFTPGPAQRADLWSRAKRLHMGRIRGSGEDAKPAE